jgi:hypothetical protein
MRDNAAMRCRRFCLLTSLLVALAASGAALGATKPVVSIRSDLPLTIHGSGFRAGEAVRVTVVMGEQHLARLTRAGAAGGFTVRFAGVRFDYCATPDAVIKARGARTGVVTAKIPVRDCAAP